MGRKGRNGREETKDRKRKDTRFFHILAMADKEASGKVMDFK